MHPRVLSVDTDAVDGPSELWDDGARESWPWDDDSSELWDDGVSKSWDDSAPAHEDAQRRGAYDRLRGRLNRVDTARELIRAICVVARDDLIPVTRPQVHVARGYRFGPGASP